MNTVATLYRSGTDEQRARGREWYPAMRRECERIADEHGARCDRVTAVLAITSPDAQLVTNVRWTREWAAAPGTKIGRYPGRMVAACDKAWTADDPGEHVSGVKVAAFYRAILGDTDALVLDRWALRMATGSGAWTVGNRREAERLYREAAAEFGETVRDMQAIIWTIGREAMTRPDGTRVKLVDIHEIGA